jgi:DNA-binding transcriptional regulator YiaG
MPNVARILKEEMARVSRREIKKAMAVLQRSSASYRTDIAALKRKVAQLERAKKDSQAERNPLIIDDKGESADKHRFSARGLRTLRQRLGLSARQLGTLIGVSEQSVYNWETKVATPRAAHLPAIVRLRQMGKREVARLLAE